MKNFTEIITIRDDQRTAFEELCFQIVHELYGDDGEIVRVDDSGGGDGVEFYQIRKDGEIWGWQTKYFSNGRLSEKGRMVQISKSLERACQIHPDLTRFILCIPMNLTTLERKWMWNENGESIASLVDKIPDGMELKVDFWGESKLRALLARPALNGVAKYFFGELRLDLDWFREKLTELGVRSLGEFDRDIHIDTDIERSASHLLWDEKSKQTHRTALNEIYELQNEFSNRSEEVRKFLEGTANAISGSILDDLLEVVKTLTDCIAALLQLTDLTLLSPNLDKTKVLSDTAKERAEDYRVSVRSTISEMIEHSTGKREEIDSTQKRWESPYWSVMTVIHLVDILHARLAAANEPALHIFGNAGVGKTDLVKSLCENQVNAGFPAILIPASRIHGGVALSEQIKHLLDVPSTYSWIDLLDAIEQAAMAHGCRIPIVLDAINEANFQGGSVDILAGELRALLTQIEKRRHLVLVTTCRLSYRDKLYQNLSPINETYVWGFEPDEAEAAVSKYFRHFDISADVSLTTMDQFRIPLYLKIFCETFKGSKEVLFLGHLSIQEVFKQFLNKCSVNVNRSLDLHPDAKRFEDALQRIAEGLWNAKTRSLPITDMFRLIDQAELSDTDIHWSDSLTNALLQQDLLVSRDWIGDGERVGFTYDLLGGYVIADWLSGTLAVSLAEFVGFTDINSILFSEDSRTGHLLADDIARNLAVKLPLIYEDRLWEVSKSSKAHVYAVEAMFEGSGESLTDSDLEHLANLFSQPENRRHILELARYVALVPDHPLNFSFWNSLLCELSLADRDLSWTEHIRAEHDWYLDRMKQTQALLVADHIEPGLEVRLTLASEMSKWLTSSTAKYLRDEATYTLYLYLRHWPQRMHDFLKSTVYLNDPYVVERIVAASYGAITYRTGQNPLGDVDTDLLRSIGREVFDIFFAESSDHATSHILTRDYAQHIVDISLLQLPDLLSCDERKRLQRPFTHGNYPKWGSMPIPEGQVFRLQSHPFASLDYDFVDDLGLGSKYRSHEQTYTDAESKLYWRVLNLGYKYEKFQKTDESIGQVNDWNYGRDIPCRFNAYARKYGRIAAYELAGVIDDRDDFRGKWDGRYDRLSWVDIDPTFPEYHSGPDLDVPDILGADITAHEDWLGTDFEEVLTTTLQTRCFEHNGEWILLDAYIHRRDYGSSRSAYLMIQSLLVQPKDVTELVDLFPRQDAGRASFWLPGVPSDLYRFAGESPWADTYPENGVDRLDLVAGISRVKETVDEAVIKIGGTFLPLESNLVDQQMLLKALNGELPTKIRAVEKERDQDVVKSFKIVIPVRTDGWESYHCHLNPPRYSATPSKEIASFLQLRRISGTHDFVDTSGKRATITIATGSGLDDTNRLTFIRRDLIARFLESNDFELIWFMHGDRTVLNEDARALNHQVEDRKYYSSAKQLI